MMSTRPSLFISLFRISLAIQRCCPPLDVAKWLPSVREYRFTRPAMPCQSGRSCRSLQDILGTYNIHRSCSTGLCVARELGSESQRSRGLAWLARTSVIGQRAYADAATAVPFFASLSRWSSSARLATRPRPISMPTRSGSFASWFWPARSKLAGDWLPELSPSTSCVCWPLTSSALHGQSR